MLSIPGEGGMMSFYGNWRVGTKHYDVICSARAGEPIDSVSYDVSEPR